MHAFAFFISLQICLPLVFRVPATESFLLTAAVVCVLVVPIFFLNNTEQPRKNVYLPLLVLPLLGLLLWNGRFAIPVAAVKSSPLVISTSFDSSEKQPITTTQTVNLEQLEHGVFAYSAITSPSGLTEKISHRWYLNGQLIDDIPMTIHGGRRNGFRAWSVKHNFPPQPAGQWKVEVRTVTNQLITASYFNVIN